MREPVRESRIEIHFCSRARELGAEVRKVKFLGRHGGPDRVVMLPGARLVWIEFKAPGEKPRASQEREHARLRAVGQQVWIVDSIPAADAALELLAC